jgi:hypothetical protein
MSRRRFKRKPAMINQPPKRLGLPGPFDGNPFLYSTVSLVRHEYDAYELTAYDEWGRPFYRRWFEHGTARRQWALTEAENWADRFYLWFDGQIH